MTKTEMRAEIEAEVRRQLDSGTITNNAIGWYRLEIAIVDHVRKLGFSLSEAK